MKKSFRKLSIPKDTNMPKGILQATWIHMPHGSRFSLGTDSSIRKTIYEYTDRYLMVTKLIGKNTNSIAPSVTLYGPDITIKVLIPQGGLPKGRNRKYRFFGWDDYYHNQYTRSHVQGEAYEGELLALRRLPNRWIPEYDEIIAEAVNRAIKP